MAHQLILEILEQLDLARTVLGKKHGDPRSSFKQRESVVLSETIRREVMRMQADWQRALSRETTGQRPRTGSAPCGAAVAQDKPVSYSSLLFAHPFALTTELRR